MEHDNTRVPHISFGHGLLRGRTLFVSDLDGTLLGSDSRVSSESALMLNVAIAGGAAFTVATARTPATAITLLKDIKISIPGAVMTGAALFDFSSRRFSRLQFLPPGVASRLVEMYRVHGVSTFIYTYSGERLEVYHIGQLNQHELCFLEERSHTPVKRFSVPPDGESLLPENLNTTMLLYSVQPWDRAYALYSEIVDRHVPVTPLCYHDTFGNEWGQLEMFGPSTSKAAAIESVASDIGAGRIVAFGDNVNDVPILRLADTAVAVGNAVPELKEMADVVIGCNDEDSVARFVLQNYKKC